MAPMMTLQAGAAFGPYVIEGFVAGGGMGRVYAAAHDVYGNAVALKVLHDRFAADPRWHTRFSQEGLLGLQLKHPHVLSARELVDHDGQTALVMDLVRGGQTLLSAIEREHPSGLAMGDALRIFLRIASGVEYLHERGLVHGDLKPENVLIEGQLRAPSDWMPRVTDFGTVALIADPVVIDGKPAVVASPRYASPEHLLGVDRLEIRSDVYALGLILHWLLSGEHASGARTVNEAAEVVLDPIGLVHVVDQPDPLLHILQTATAPTLEARYRDCRELALAIRDVLDEIGMKLQLDDLQSELATEIMEARAEAQKALQRGEGPHPDDTDLDPGSVIEYAGVYPTDAENGLPDFNAELVDVDELEAAEAGPEAEPEPESEVAADPLSTPGADAPQAEQPNVQEDVVPIPPDKDQDAAAGSRAAPSGLGGLKIRLGGGPAPGDDPPSDDDHSWGEPADDLPTEPAGARVVVSQLIADEDSISDEAGLADESGADDGPSLNDEPAIGEAAAHTPSPPSAESASSLPRFVLMMVGVGAVLGLLTVLIAWGLGLVG
jgi:serine/threonine-protein kinase